MRKIVFAFAVCTVIGLLAASCSEKEKESDETLRTRSFDAWVQVYGEGAEKLASGIYVKKLRSSSNPNAQSPKDTCWVMINYTGKSMVAGDVYTTRYPDVAKHQGTFTDYTHYIPDYVPFTPLASVLYSSNLDMTVGNYMALSEMKEGDLWRVYIPSDMAYGSNGYSNSGSGFGGQNALAADLPVIVDLELVKVVPSPYAYEIEQVQQYAALVMKKNLSDTIRKNVYLQQLKPSTDTTTIKKDSTVKAYYVGRFLDGFVFDTNIKDTAVKYKLAQYYSDSHYEPIEIKVGASSNTSGESSGGEVVKGMDYAVGAMHYGETAQVIFSSTYGYGPYGSFPTYSSTSTSGGTIIPPYSPLIFDIEVTPHYGDGTKKYPYTTYPVQHLLGDVDGVWVMGYVVGVIPGDDVKSAVFTLDSCKMSAVKNNLILGDNNSISYANTGPKPYAVCFSAELPEGKIRDALNVPDNEGKVYHMRVKLFGNIRTYKGVRGIVDITDYKIE